jgi:hypothetical protein
MTGSRSGDAWFSTRFCTKNSLVRRTIPCTPSRPPTQAMPVRHEMFSHNSTIEFTSFYRLTKFVWVFMISRYCVAKSLEKIPTNSQAYHSTHWDRTLGLVRTIDQRNREAIDVTSSPLVACCERVGNREQPRLPQGIAIQRERGPVRSLRWFFSGACRTQREIRFQFDETTNRSKAFKGSRWVELFVFHRSSRGPIVPGGVVLQESSAVSNGLVIHGRFN